MRAVRCVGGAPSLVDAPAPSGEGVRVHVVSAGICGSDLHLLQWDLPFVMGHELAGTLDDGTPVAVEPIEPCWICAPCRDGAYNRCVLGPAMVMGVGREGGMAEQCLVPATSIARLPAGIALKDACLVEPLAVAVHGVRQGRIGASQRVAIVGGGAIGQTALVAAQAVGATVDLEARHDSQREAAERLGAGTVCGEYDVVIEAGGTESALARAVELCRPGGRVVLLGTYWDGGVVMPGMEICMKEVELVPACMYGRSGPSRDFDVAVAVLAARPAISETVISHRFPLNAVADAFSVARDRAAGAIKVVLEPQAA
ncbi:MAG TPA: alcohol dehydrogenase catalytic domain-containing protein [Acidimicrobiales bacterium]|jgi:threonine dehydrogenase-like Zn-dependent dehydrogenase